MSSSIDFTTDEYRRLLEMAVSRYSCVRFTDCIPEEGGLLWRHDIDFSVHRAVKAARIESEFGALATYFIQLSSMFYNVFEREIQEKLAEIRTLGHDIGLHFDPGAYRVNSEDVTKCLYFEKDVLERLLNIEIKAVSLHNPDVVSDGDEFITKAGLINTYDFLPGNGWMYCSDSNGYWRYDPLRTVLQKAPPQNLHVLTHPAWWQDEPLTPRARIERCARGRAERTMERYDANLAKANRKNIAK